jgi:hypothetical protein
MYLYWISSRRHPARGGIPTWYYSAGIRVEFVSDSMSYIIKSARWCDMWIMWRTASARNRNVRSINSLNNIWTFFLPDWNSEAGKENLFKSTIANLSVRVIIKNNGFKVVSFATCQKSQSNAQCSHIVTGIKLLERRLMKRPAIELAMTWYTEDGP